MSRPMLVLACAMFLASCTVSTGPDPASVPFRRIEVTLRSGVRPDAEAIAIRDADTWRRHIATPGDPPVNFASEMAVLLTRDTPTPCHRLRLDSAGRRGPRITLAVVIEAPGSGCVCVQVVGLAAGAYAMPLADAVTVEWTPATYSCR
jgi:hypothetical protein